MPTLFIAGGDQSDYVNLWKDTPVEDAIHALLGKGVPIGGTSAGLAILGQYGFAALNGSITSEQALANPFNRRQPLVRDFWSHLASRGSSPTATSSSATAWAGS